MISYRDKGTLADSYIAKDAIKLSQANIVGFHRLQGKTFHKWVSQATQPSHLIVGFHRLFTVKPTFTLRTS